MWKPCLPGDRPVRSATTCTSLPCCVKVAFPVTLVLAGCVAAALDGRIVADAICPPACIFDADDDDDEFLFSELHPARTTAAQATNDAMVSAKRRSMRCLRQG